jgi:lysozyme
MNQTAKIIVASLLFCLFTYMLLDKFYLKKHSKMYPNFGIRIPNGYAIHGIDVSKYQTDINWKLVSKMRDKGIKLDFAIMKASEGTSNRDRFFSDNWQQSKDHNMIRGAYHYFHPNMDGTLQADFFMNQLDMQKGDLAPVIDIEVTDGVSKDKLQKRLQDCLDALEKKYDTKPIIYCNVDFYKAHLGDKFNDYPLWCAHYQVDKPDIDRNWTIWQHSDRGHVNGIDGNVDFNTVNGDLISLKSLCVGD